MKQDLTDLRRALPGEPESCRTALLQAARSVKEEKPVKKYAFRTVLVVALIIAAMTAVALAAANGGLMNWFQDAYDATLPKAAQEVLNATEKTNLETDLVTFHVNELLCDGKIAYLTAEAQLKEEGTAILYPNCADPNERIGELLAQKLNHAGVDAKTTYADAAKATGLPLYCVGVSLEVNGDALIESEMMDGSLLENGQMLLVRMLYFQSVLDAETLPVTIVARVNEVDLETLEFVEGSRQRVEVDYALPIHGVTAERSYQPEEGGQLSGYFTLTGVEAQQTCAGVYVTLKTKADAPMTLDAFYEINDEWDVLDAQGNRFPTGISLTGEYLDGSGQPIWLNDGAMIDELQFMLMISVDELPETFIVTDGTVQIPVK